MKTKILKLSELNLVSQITLIAAVSIIITFTVHLIPNINNKPIGVYLIPLFYTPVIALHIFKAMPIAIVSAITPYFFYLLIGKPDLDSAAFLSMEVFSFTLIMSYLMNRFKKLKIASLISFASAKLISYCLMFLIPVLAIKEMSLSAYFYTLFISFPGLMIMLLIENTLRRNPEK